MTDEPNTDPGTTRAQQRMRGALDRMNDSGESVRTLRGFVIEVANRVEEVAADVERRYQNIANTIGVLRAELRLINERVTALESARVTPAEARESDPVCANPGCVHPKGWHTFGDGSCKATNCLCKMFRPAAPPSPDPLCGKCSHRQSLHMDGEDECYGIGMGDERCACLSFSGPAAPPAPEPAPTVALDPIAFVLAGAYRQWYAEAPRDLLLGNYLLNAFKLAIRDKSDYDLVERILAYGDNS